MNLILLSGGSGKRLWPLSNDIRSKQFIRIFRGRDGELESMLQRVYRQVKLADPQANITVATGKKQVSSIKNQLNDGVNICVEPARRDTFPAICLAGAYLKDVCGLGEEEPVIVCPVDPYVEDSYYDALMKLSRLVQTGASNLYLMGMEPTYPSEKYGYVIPMDRQTVSGVRTFREKPDKVTAQNYLDQGALWNGGVFAFRLGYLLQRAHEQLDFTDYEDLYHKYHTVPKISFDYAVAETEPSISVMRYRGEWKDLGTWNTFSEAMEENAIGKVAMDQTCEDTHVVNELNIPILVMGCRNLIVAASGDGILVSDKSQSSYIKPYVDRIEQQVMYAEKSWGSFTVLDVQEDSMTIKITLHPSNRLHYHSHELRDEVWTIISGYGRVILDGKERKVIPGDVVSMKAGCKHTLIADGDLTAIEVQMGQSITVEDKLKFEL
jgi:mannose-1-phosphate guanylyltransferase